ncbi:hypothetical protein C8R45DRAFT_933767 [Mycena sanguinolenta]|nr:hypothetical protein C8R45DRAFT_933767 [Mycena sanguinolenta]
MATHSGAIDAVLDAQVKALQKTMQDLPHKYTDTLADLNSARAEFDAASAIDARHKTAEDDWKKAVVQYQAAVKKLTDETKLWNECATDLNIGPPDHSKGVITPAIKTEVENLQRDLATATNERQVAAAHMLTAVAALDVASVAAKGAEARYKTAATLRQGTKKPFRPSGESAWRKPATQRRQDCADKPCCSHSPALDGVLEFIWCHRTNPETQILREEILSENPHYREQWLVVCCNAILV